MTAAALPGAGSRVSAVREPLIPNVVLAMALVIFTEVMLFAGLVSSYVVLRGQALMWPPPGQPRLPIELTALNTGILLASGYAILLAMSRQPHHRASSAGTMSLDGSRAFRWLTLALALGTTFLVVQGYEWTRLLEFGLSASKGVYAGVFYATIGTHAVHVLAGVLALAWGMVAARRGRLTRDGLRALQMFWAFVVLVWPFLYIVVYLW
jgi:cytochrome c oxidase subunit III